MKIVLVTFIGLSMNSFCQLPLELKKSVCDKSMHQFVEMSIDHLKSISLNKNLLSIELGLIENCSFRFGFNAMLSVNTDTLNIQYVYQPVNEIDSSTGSIIYRESIAMCDCFFNIKLEIDSIQSIPSVVMITKTDVRKQENNYESYSQLFLMKNNGLPVIPEKFKKHSKKYNQLDQHGNKIGLWRTENDKFIVYTHYIESKNLQTIPFWVIVFNHQNELKYFEVMTKYGQYSVSEKERKLLEEKLKKINNM